MLTASQIQELAGRKGVRKIAVENFLGTVSENPDKLSAIRNLWNDARAYGWNAATVAAIRIGVEKHFARGQT